MHAGIARAFLVPEPTLAKDWSGLSARFRTRAFLTGPAGQHPAERARRCSRSLPGFQRGLSATAGRQHATGSMRGAIALTRAIGTVAAGTGSEGAARPDAVPPRSAGGAGRRQRGPGDAGRSGPFPVGPGAGSRWPAGAWKMPSPPGGPASTRCRRRSPAEAPRPDRAGYRLAADRPALPAPRGHDRLARGRVRHHGVAVGHGRPPGGEAGAAEASGERRRAAPGVPSCPRPGPTSCAVLAATRKRPTPMKRRRRWPGPARSAGS